MKPRVKITGRGMLATSRLNLHKHTQNMDITQDRVLGQVLNQNWHVIFSSFDGSKIGVDSMFVKILDLHIKVLKVKNILHFKIKQYFAQYSCKRHKITSFYQPVLARQPFWEVNDRRCADWSKIPLWCQANFLYAIRRSKICFCAM